MDIGDYQRALGLVGEAVPSYDQMRENALRATQLGLQNTAGQLEIDANQRKVADDDAFRASVAQLGPRSQVSDYSNLLLRHPGHADQIKTAWGLQSAEGQRQQLSTMSQAWSAVHNGKPELAVALLRRSQDALKAEGLPEDPEDATFIADLESGDPQRVAGVKSQLGVVLASVAGPEHFGSTLNAIKGQDEGYTLNGGDIRYDAQNRAVASAPYRPEMVRVRDGDGGERVFSYQPGSPLDQRGGMVDTGYASAGDGTPAPASGGGAGATRGVRNNNPGNLEASPFTRRQPGYVGSDGRFARFATPADGIRAHEALLNGSYFGKGIDTIDGIVRKYAPAADGNDTGAYTSFLAKKVGIPSGQRITDPAQRSKLFAAMRNYESRYQKAEPAALTLIASGSPKPGWRIMTPAEVAKQPNLDPTRAYQMSGEGRVSPIGTKPTSTSAPSRAVTLAGVIAPIFQKVKDGKALTAGEQQALTLYRSRGTRAARGAGGEAAPDNVQPAGEARGVPGTRQNPVPVTLPADVASLPAGAWWRNPQGRVGQKP